MANTVNLKRFREKYQLTQSAAAQQIGIDQRQWNRYENAKNDLPVRYLKAICTNFNVSADWLLGLKNEEGGSEMEKYEKLYNEIIDLIYHCKEQKFIPESEAEYILGKIEEIKANIDHE